MSRQKYYRAAASVLMKISAAACCTAIYAYFCVVPFWKWSVRMRRSAVRKCCEFVRRTTGRWRNWQGTTRKYDNIVVMMMHVYPPYIYDFCMYLLASICLKRSNIAIKSLNPEPPFIVCKYNFCIVLSCHLPVIYWFVWAFCSQLQVFSAASIPMDWKMLTVALAS